MKHYFQDKQSVCEALETTERGLSAEEAARRLARDGENKLREGSKKSLLRRFLDQILDPMILILLGAAAISVGTSIYSHESFADVFIILFVVVLNSILGVVQESKAEKAIEALKAMSAATTRVLRGGRTVVVKSSELVKGDLIILETGDSVPADVRITEAVSLKTEEAALTGESLPVEKTDEVLPASENGDIPLGDRRNMAYMGSSVVYGHGRAVVVATGMDTEMGKIADQISNAEKGETPLQLKLDQLGKILTYLVLGICAFIFVFSLLKSGSFSAEVILNTFMLAVSLAVAAIPEGLVAVVTIVLSIGVTRMSERRAIIRKLTAVETLGCTEVICSDKTGTLTQNKMTVVDKFGDNGDYLPIAMCLCNDAEIQEDGEADGEPTEVALVNAAVKAGFDKKKLDADMPRVMEIPFDSGRKMMSTLHKNGGKYIQFTKGAPDVLLRHCSRIRRGGNVETLTPVLLGEILSANKSMASKALRVLAAAYREYDEKPAAMNSADNENDLVFIGLYGMIDPVRPEAVEAIKECKRSGIRAVMITGDHQDTATAIASELGIIDDPSQVITGTDLNKLDDDELVKSIDKYSVFARVQPEHKTRIVKAWKKRGCVTAMTGDGVNDAPAIKNADIGVGMGITGTDVTKNVADMVLADDNFATIVSAVEEGRRIYDNIRRTIQFLLSSNLAEVLLIFLATLMGFVILNPVQLLWINLITDMFPALALGMEYGEPDLMNRRPRSSSEGIFAGGMGGSIIYQGIACTILPLAAYFIGHYMENGVWEITNSVDGMTMAFLTLSMTEIFHSFNLRSLHGSIFTLKKQNVFLFLSMIASLILTGVVIYVPFLTASFGFSEISLTEYLTAMGLALCIIPIVEIVKIFQRKRLAAGSRS
jgi:Ca2+-transporting ATPase